MAVTQRLRQCLLVDDLDPREVLISVALGFISESSRGPIIARVSSASGTCSVTMSASHIRSSRETQVTLANPSSSARGCR